VDGTGVLTPELCVEIAGILTQGIAQGVVNLVKDKFNLYLRVVFDFDPGAVRKRHGKAAIKAFAFLHTDILRQKRSLSTVGHAKKIAKGTFYAGSGLPIPIGAQDDVSHMQGIARGNGNPNMPYHSRSLGVQQDGSAAGQKVLDAGVPLSSIPAFSSGPLLTARVFRGSRPGSKLAYVINHKSNAFPPRILWNRFLMDIIAFPRASVNNLEKFRQFSQCERRYFYILHGISPCIAMICMESIPYIGNLLSTPIRFALQHSYDHP